MKIETAQHLVDAADDLGFELRIREDYSGRGMFGKTTAGVVAESTWHVIQAAAHWASFRDPDTEAEALEEFVEDLRGLSSDSMGYDVIWY